MKKKVSLFKYIMGITITLFSTFVFSFIVLSFFNEYTLFQNLSKQIKENSLKRTKESLKEDVEHLKNHILVLREQFLQNNSDDLDQIEQKAQKFVIDHIEALKKLSNDSSYFFIGDWNGVSKTFPAKGKNMLHIQDSNGLFIVKELIQKAKSGGGFVRYIMPSIEGIKSTQKISYTQGIDVWQWYVGAGVYEEDLDEQIKALENQMFSKVIYIVILTIIISLFIIGIFFFILKKIQYRLDSDFKIFEGFLQSLVDTNEPIDKKAVRFQEFSQIADKANEMLVKKDYLERRLELFSQIVNTSGDCMSIVDQEYKYLAVNPAYEEFFKKSKEQIEGVSARELFGTEQFESNIKPLNDRALAGEQFSVEVEVLDGLNRPRRLLVSYFPYYESGQDRPSAFVIYARDVTKQYQAKEQLELWAKVFERTSEAVVITDAKRIIQKTNKAFSKITEYDIEEVKGKSIDMIYDEKSVDFSFREDLEKRGFWIGESVHKTKSGKNYPALMNSNIIKDEEGRVTNYVAIFSDISTLKESQKQLEFLAHHDILTGLPNRLLLQDRIEHAIDNAKRLHTKLGICFVDLDDFKKINDSYGHSYGDDVLKQVTQRIQNVIRTGDTLSRIGGDEFILLLENIDGVAEIEKVISKVQETLIEPFLVKQKRFFLTASIGASIYPDHGNNAEILTRNADIAMYKAKDSGKNIHTYFSDHMSLDSFVKVSIEEELKEAISKNQFVIYYQPQIDLQSKELVGFEALLRWNHPQEGILSPGVFIDFAETSRMIIPIGDFVLKQACADLVMLQKEFNIKPRMSINVSGIQIEFGDFIETLKDAIKSTNVDPSDLELEITESVFMNDPQRWINLLNTIKQNGVKIAIDDFGTGFSSLSYLKELPIDKLKIDMSFVRDVPHDKGACSIVRSVIDLSDNMNLLTLAEGIETEDQEAFLQQHHCKEAQGYMYAKPMDINSLRAWIRNRSQS